MRCFCWRERPQKKGKLALGAIRAKPRRSTTKRMNFTSEEVLGRMKNVQWIRECCTKLLRLDAQLHSGEVDVMEAMRDFFSRGWTSPPKTYEVPRFIRDMTDRQDELNRIACMNTFAFTSKYLTEVMEKKKSIALDASLHTLAKDIQFNMYAVWIEALCAKKKVPVAGARRDMQIVVPPSLWEACYAKDALIADLETLYGKYLPFTPNYQRGTVLVRLNGERMQLV